MDSKVKVHINVEAYTKQLAEVYDEALGFEMKDILNDVNRYVKVRTGELKDSAYIDDNTIKYGADYSEKAYYAETAGKEYNPNAQPEWADYAEEKHMETWAKRVSRRGKK